MTNFETLYNDVIKKALVEKFGYKNPHEIPKLTKIVLNMGVGDAITDKKKLNNAVDSLSAWLIWLFLVSETFTAFRERTLTEEGTLLLALKSRLFSLKLTMKRLNRSEVWILLSALRPRQTKKPSFF